jgi:putative ABC transport system permease protein
VRVLDRKLLRDLWSTKGQVISIALVIASGIGGFIGCISTYESLQASRERYYDTARFPHVFATLTRAPVALEERIRAIPGVTEVETRVVRDAQLSIPGVGPPMVARLIGVDFARRPAMNRLALTSGRWPAPGSTHDALVNERFFTARGLALGDPVDVLVNGRLERYAIAGTVLSPEFVIATRGGGLPDDEWFAVLWVDGKALAAAYDMEGAFDSALVRLERDASSPAVVESLDALLDPYGGVGAVGREDQISHKLLSQEISQQQVFGTVLPAIVLAVAAFILNVVLHRHVNTQRPEIAALKAVGYGDGRIAAHFLQFAAAIALLGVVFGIGVGWWFGHAMTELYTRFFHFPEFAFVIPPAIVVAGAAIALVAAAGGTLAAIRGVVRLRPAEALRPPAPAQFRPLLVERLGYARLLTPSQRMVMRNLERKPLRAATTVAGIAGALAIMLAGIFWADAVERFMDVTFDRANRGSVQVGFVQPLVRSVRYELERLPGVRQAEVSRMAPVRLRAGHRSYRTVINGITDDARLQRAIDGHALVPVPPSPDGIVLTSRLAERLAVRPGDLIHAEFIDGQRKSAQVRIAGLVDEIAGMNGWMRLDDLNALASDGDVVSSAQLLVDRDDEPRLLAALKGMPAAAVVIVSRTLLETFRSTSARNLLFFTTVMAGFAATIAAGVVYNNARIQLAERAWELASLRVLGFTRGEVSVLLLGELALEIAVAIPVGLVAGFGLAALLIFLAPHDVMELPLVINPRTYLLAACVIAVAGVASALVVRGRINRLDLVAVLKTRE